MLHSTDLLLVTVASDKQSGPISGVKQSWTTYCLTVDDGTNRLPEMLVPNYQSALPKIPEEKKKTHLHCRRYLKSCK